jgi:uncharacterized protein
MRMMMRAWLGWVGGIVLLAGMARADDLQPVPALAARVTDNTATLSANEKQALESKLAQLEQRKGSQVAVLIVATTQPEDIDQYSYRVADAWKLGRKGVDDGVLLTVAKNDHHVRIEVGRGLEGAIPDAATARIIREYITPKFRGGDYAGGINDAVDALTKLIDGEPLPPPLESASKSDHRNGNFFLNNFVFIIFGVFWLRALVGGLPSVPRAGIVGAVTAGVAWFLSGWLLAAVGLGIFGLIIGLVGGIGGGFANRGGSGGWSGGFGGGSFGGGGGFSGGGGGGGFSGGGGGFAGGGASGSW